MRKFVISSSSSCLSTAFSHDDRPNGLGSVVVQTFSLSSGGGLVEEGDDTKRKKLFAPPMERPRNTFKTFFH